MPSPRTVQRWQDRFRLPTTVATVYVVLYLGFVVFESSARGESTVSYLRGPEHALLAHPLGWLFVLSLPFVLIGFASSIYALLAGY